MVSLPTLPRRFWVDRAFDVIALLVILVGATAMAGWALHLDALVQPFPTLASIKFNEAICLLILGLVLVGIDRGMEGISWLALVPGAIASLTLIEAALGVDFRIDELLVIDHLPAGTAHAGRMSALSALALTFVSIALAWCGAKGWSQFRLLYKATIGSITASAGFSTLMGYAVNLPAVYRWGTASATAPVAAIGLFLLGLALLLFAWRKSLKAEGGPPAWSPMPTMVGCLTVTIILWIGLREREVAYLNAKTQTAMDTLATTISSEFDRQASMVERLARKWGELTPEAAPVWEVDARTPWEESKDAGCVLIAVINADLRTVWVYPRAGNEAMLDYDHGSEIVLDPDGRLPDPGSTDRDGAHDSLRIRRTAIDAARLALGPVISTTLELHGRGKGVVIYSPIIRNGRPAGYVAAEFLYRQFFNSIILDRKLAADYRIHISIAGESLYGSPLSATADADAHLAIDRPYSIFNRRVRLTLAPSPEALQHERRYLPELAFGAGFGITVLLGLSVHLARSARAGQRAAEFSNRKLHAENEERRRIEARLKISDERLRLALDSTQIGIFEQNVAAGHVYYSPGLWSMLGYEHGRMAGTVDSWQSLIHPDDLPMYRRRVESQLNGIASFIEPEYRVRARTGEWRWVYSRSKTVGSSATGRPTRIIGTVQDITARREAEQALRESQAETRKLSLVAAKTDNPVLITSPAGTIEWVNESFTRVMEYSLDEVVGRNPADFIQGPGTDRSTLAQIRSAMEQGQGVSTDIVSFSKSGRKYHLRLELQPIRNEAGQLQNFIAIETDITARVETEQTLRRAKSEADEASRAKSEFLASMSHEIRTPMNGVIGMTSLLMETPLNPEQRDFVNTIRTSGEALLTIINDILDFSKIESGKLELEHTPFDLSLCIEDALDLFALQAAAKQLEITYHIAPEVPPWIMGDVTRLRQVLVNLVNNAVKFTAAGSIAIEIRRTPDRAAAVPRFLLEFTVRDTGIGIPVDRLDRLFKAFSQVDSSTTRRFGGTGLGLAISQRLTHLMGGGIRVESQVDQGSSFIFTIATEAAPIPADLDPPEVRDLKHVTVLCVEDHPVTQRRLRTLFESVGATCHVAANPFAAAAIAAQLSAPPSLLVADADESAGVPAFDALASVDAPWLLMLPFGQTAPPVPLNRQACASIFKPFKTAPFLHLVAMLLNPVSRARASVDTTAAAQSRLAQEYPLDVLLAEDNTVNQKVALRFLERLGYRADAVSNGLEAVATLESRDYDLVLMDLQMPEMDGLEASRQIRRRLPAARQPKIIALTANAMQGDRERCLEAGMDDYISKPVKLHEIEAVVRRLFGPGTAPHPDKVDPQGE